MVKWLINNMCTLFNIGRLDNIPLHGLDWTCHGLVMC